SYALFTSCSLCRAWTASEYGNRAGSRDGSHGRGHRLYAGDSEHGRGNGSSNYGNGSVWPLQDNGLAKSEHRLPGADDRCVRHRVLGNMELRRRSVDGAKGHGPRADARRSRCAVRGADVKPKHDAQYWAKATAGFDFSDADRVSPYKFNRVLWKA